MKLTNRQLVDEINKQGKLIIKQSVEKKQLQDELDSLRKAYDITNKSWKKLAGEHEQLQQVYKIVKENRDWQEKRGDELLCEVEQLRRERTGLLKISKNAVKHYCFTCPKEKDETCDGCPVLNDKAVVDKALGAEK